MVVQKEGSVPSEAEHGDLSGVRSLAQLHARLRSAQPNDVADLKARIRARVPPRDMALMPHRKTPRGRTCVLLMNYIHSQTTAQAEMDHLHFFADVAHELGLRLDIVMDKGCQYEIEQALQRNRGLEYTITPGQMPISKWAEDSVEYLENGHVAVLQPFDEELLQWAMTQGRRQRWQGKLSPENLEAALRDDHLWILLGTRVNALKTGLERERAAQSKGQPVGHIRAYIEGGNMIAGEDAAGNPILLVGKDAIAATANLYQLCDIEVRQIIAEDFGLDTIENIVCVEQPGKFHLDMGMLFVGDGCVISNDSSAAFKDAVEMADLVPSLTTQAMADKLQLQCRLEDDAANDLQRAGLNVRREKLENNVFYNFFNGEFVEGVDGCSYYITNGGPRDQEKRLEVLLVEELGVVKKIFFSPLSAAQKSLQEHGGVGCRIKGSRPYNSRP